MLSTKKMKIGILFGMMLIFGILGNSISHANFHDQTFETPTVFGRVFLDENRNGYYDDGEAGVGGVKLVSAQGEIITTDSDGRYSLPVLNQTRGNYILKLDSKSLPKNYKITTENPAIVRLSPGMPSEINFGVAPKPTKEEKKK